VLLGTIGVPLDSAVNVDFPFITAHFHLVIADIRWIVIAYTLTSASLLLVLGRISDLIGHRRMFLAGTLLCAVAYALCASAPSYPWLLAARIAQGVGAAMVMACGTALITSVFPEAARVRALGLYTLGFGLGGALGPLAGAVLIARWGWSAVFWGRVPFALAGALAGLTLPRDRRAGPRPRFDWPGALLLVAAIVALLAAFNQLTAPPRALAALALAGALGAGFVTVERRAGAPLIDLALFRLPGFARVNLAAVGVNLASFAVLLLMPFALARDTGLPVALGGLLLAAAPAGVAVAGPLGGRLAGRLKAATLLRGGAGLCALGLAGIALVPPAPGYRLPPAPGHLALLTPGHLALLAVAMIASGLGAGLFQVAFFDALTGTIPRHDRGVAGSLGMLARSLGIVAGASLLMALFAPLHAALGFTSALRATFLCAAALAAAMAVTSRR
jgi:MFS family permease